MPSTRNKTLKLTPSDRERNVQTVTTDTVEGIFCCDVVQALQLLEGRNYKLIIADPPYNLGVDFGNESDKQSEEEYVLWFDKWVGALKRAAAPDASLYVCTDWTHSG